MGFSFYFHIDDDLEGLFPLCDSLLQAYLLDLPGQDPHRSSPHWRDNDGWLRSEALEPELDTYPDSSQC